jgi:iron complex outermembrane receptor protein
MLRYLTYVAAIGAAFSTVGTVNAWADDAPSSESESVATSEITTLPPLVVTASPIAGEADRFTTIVDQVSRDEILKSGGANLADALENVPGVTGSGFAAGASRPVIRGFDANRVRILESGIGSFDVSDVGPDHGVPIDPLAAQRIEIIRGAATLRYGSQAIGGVVNAINNRVPTELPDEFVSGEVAGAYGTNANTKEGSVLGDMRVGQFAVHADGFGHHTDDYDTPEGTLSNSYFKGNSYSFGSSYFFGEDSRIGAAIVQHDAEYGIPGEDAYIDMKQTKELFRSSFALDLGALSALTVEGGHGDYEHSEKEPDGTPTSTFKDKEWEGRAEALFDPVGPFSGGAIGVQYQHRDFSALGEGEDYLLPTTTKSAAGFFFAEAPLGEAVSLQFGGRVERVSVEGTPISGIQTTREFTPVSGSVGVLFDASQAVKLGLTLSSAERAPAQTELFARGPHEGTATYETGDETLKVERANSLEGTVRVRLDRVRFDGAVWGAKFDNYIYGNLTGRTCDEAGVCGTPGPDDLKELFYEQGGARFWGAELKSTVDLYRSDAGVVEANFLADYVRAKLDDGAGNVPRIPPYHLGSGLSWKSDMFDAGFMVKYAGSQRDVGTAETTTGSFVSLNAQLAWRPFQANPGLEFAVVGKNLTDTVQRNAVALNKDEVIQPGRDVRFVIRTVF